MKESPAPMVSTNLYARRVQLDDIRASHDQGTLASECHQRDSAVVRQHPARRLRRRRAWVQPGQIVVAGLDYIASTQHALQASAVPARVLDRGRPAVRIKRHQRGVVDPVDERLERRRHRLEDEAERPDVEGPDVRWQDC